MVSNKQALVTKHLEGLSHGDLSPAQVLESCHYVYEASSTHGDGSRDSGSTRLVAHLATNLPEVLTFHGVPLNPSDVFAVQNILKIGGTEGRSFCLDLEDSGYRSLDSELWWGSTTSTHTGTGYIPHLVVFVKDLISYCLVAFPKHKSMCSGLSLMYGKF